jgi:cell wall-associated NlpC family hydrolase
MANVSVSGGSVKTPVGQAPVIPLILVGLGSYLAWFGVKYWRGEGEAAWPSYPIKSVLQGKGTPAPEPATSTAVELTSYESSLAGAEKAGGSGGNTADGSAAAADAETYVGKINYTWGGGHPPNVDCSGLCNWIYGHDLKLDIPEMPRGQVFDGSSHGPDVASWLAWSGVQHVSSHQPGDIVAWGPNEHMGVVVSSTECVSALDPALGCKKLPIAETHTGVPTFLRLRAIARSAGARGGTPGQNQKLAGLLAARYGWSPSQNRGQWNALVQLWNMESSWETNADNPLSGAWGIPQALPGSKMASAGSDWKTNPRTQIIWGLGYIHGRYGSPEEALAFHERNGWY